MKNHKKLLAFFIATLVAFTMFIGLSLTSSAWWDYEPTLDVESITAEPITVIQNDIDSGYWNTAYDANGNEYDYFHYTTPSYANFTVTLKDGTVLQSEWGYVEYDGYTYWIDADSYQYENPLKLGTNEVTVYLSESEFTLTVNVVETPIASIEIENEEIIENCDGYWDYAWDENDNEYDYFYYYLDNFDYTVTLKDGTVFESDYAGEIWYDEEWIEPYVQYQQYKNPLTVGTHNIPVSILGFDTTVTVKIIESPVKSVTIEPQVLIENCGGYWDYIWDENDNETEFFYYYLSSFDYTVTLKDGTVLESDYWGIEYNGVDYELDVNYSQYDEPLTVGKNTVDVSIMGYDTTAVVEIIESPVKSVTIEPQVLIENCDGYWGYNGDENDNETEFFYYYLSSFDYTVTLKDGTVLESDYWGIEYNGVDYELDVNYSQYDKPFTAGKNTVDVSIMGYDTTAVVEIIETPVKSVTIEPQVLIENCDGYWGYNGDENDNETEFFYYYLSSFDYTVTLKDGTVLESDYWGIEYNGVDYELDVNYSQYDKPFTAGKNTVDVSIMGYDTTAVVEIIESPVKSVTIEPVKIIENAYGYTDITDDGESYFYYYVDFNYTVTLKDGTILTSENERIKYNDRHYYINTLHSQYKNPFKLGKNNYAVSILGFDTTATVEIIESPVSKIEIAPATIGQYTRGYWDYTWTDDDEIEYFYRYIDFSPLKYTVTLKDGTVLNGSCISDYYYGIEYLGVSYRIEVSFEDELVVGKNTVDVSILGKKTQATVEIVEDKDVFRYNEYEDCIVITGVNNRAVKTLTIPTAINNKPVVGIAYLGAFNATEIVVPDSVKFLSDGWLSGCEKVEKITLGSAVEQIGSRTGYYGSVTQIDVSADNPNFKSVDGVVYSKDGKTLLVYPIEKGNTYTVPATVTNIDVLLEDDIYSDINIVIPENSTNFVTVDGVTYNADKTKILFSDKTKTGNYVMPDTVTSISNYAFDGSKIESLTISKNVNEIVYGVFANCTSLKNVTIPDSVKTIKYSAFRNCQALESITLSKSLEFIGNSAFVGCESLKQINLPDTLESIGSFAFYCTGLTSVVIPDSVSEIGNSIFEYCTALKSVKLSAGLKEIPSYSFYGCEALDTITVPDSIEHIGYGAFGNTAYVENEANYKDGMLYIGKVLYATNDKLSATVTVADGTMAIGENAFYNNDNITKVVFPSSLKYIEGYSFYGCENLTSAELPEGLEYIGDMSFDGTALTSVKIPSTVTDIVYRAFSNSDVAKIDMPNTLISIDGTAFDDTEWYEAQPDGEIYLGSTLYNYKGTMNTETEITVKDGTLVIASRAFDSEVNLKNVVLPEGLVEIGDAAFYLTGIESLTIPSSVKTIGSMAFYNCLALESVVIPPTVKEIGEDAFGSWYTYKLVIYGAKGSAAEAYATDNRIKFVEMQFTSTELVVPENNSNITVKDTVANVTPEMSVTAFAESVDNEKVRVLAADGKELAKDAFLGTGTKIQVLDTDGTVLSEYEVMVKSDVDGDGKVNPADARLALRAAAGIDKIAGVYETAANYDEKDSVSPADARMILRKSVGLE